MKQIKIVMILLFAVLFMLPCNSGKADALDESFLKEKLIEIASLDELSEHESIIESEISNLYEYFDGKVVVYRIKYKSDDCEVIGYVGAPVDYLEKKYPVLIYNRGGNRAFGKLDPNSIASYTEAGYVVLASQYRGVDGGTGLEQFGGDDVNDVIKLIDISESFGFIEAGGVYMAGHSRGGMMTYIVCRRENRIQAAAIFAGVSDLVATYNDREYAMKQVCIELLGGSPDELPDEYEKRSAVNWADEINVPLLIIHGGKKDWRVSTSQSEKMAELLEKYNKEYRLIIYEEADHSLNGTPYGIEMIKWFEEHPIN